MSMHSQQLVSPTTWDRPQPSSKALPAMISIVFVVSVTMLMMAVFPILIHWFLIPVALSGILIGTDAIRWFRGEFDVMDVRGILALVGLHFFWFSALLIPANGYTPFPLAGVQNLDFRPWLGVMGVFNCAGILLYQWTATWISSRPFKKPVKVRRGDLKMVWILIFMIIVGFISQGFLLATLGLEVKSHWGERRVFSSGFGIPIVFRSCVPILLMFLITCFSLSARHKTKSLFVLSAILLVLTGISLIFNGLTGNRGSTVFTAFWIVGVIHYFWRPIRRYEIIILVVCFLLFMFTYLFYKQYGVYGLKTFLNEGAQAAQATGRDRIERSFSGMLVGDMSRSHIHSYAAYVLIQEPYSYRLRYGATVPADIMSIVPRWLFPNQYNVGGYSGKHVAGTEMIRGPNTFDAYTMMGREPRMWGIAGNMMLNFGIYSVPFGYLILGVFVGWSQRVVRKWRATSDIRLLFAPLLVMLALIILAMDPQVMTMYTLRYFMLPILIVFFGSNYIGKYMVPLREVAK